MSRTAMASQSGGLTAERPNLEFGRDAAELRPPHASVDDPAWRRPAVDLVRALAPADQATPRAAPQTGRDRSDAQTCRLLLVDDDHDVLVLVGGFLEAEGFGVARASGGTDAISMLTADDHIDGVVTDFTMPGMSGAELVAAARRLRPALPAIVITGYAGSDGFDGLPPDVVVLRKPFRRSALVAAVRELLKHDASSRGPEAQGDAR